MYLYLNIDMCIYLHTHQGFGFDRKDVHRKDVAPPQRALEALAPPLRQLVFVKGFVKVLVNVFVKVFVKRFVKGVRIQNI